MVVAILIGVIVAWVVARGRGKMKLPMAGKHWLWVIVGVVVLLAIIYGASGHVSNH